MLRTFALVVVIAACGANKPLGVPADKPAAGSGAGSGSNAQAAAEKHEEMASMPPDVAKFHDVLAPLWHAAPGGKRMADTCAALPDFHADADAIAIATPPTTANADTWTTATKNLVAAVAGLDAPCKANDQAPFEAAFTRVHEGFHGLLEAAGPNGAEQHKM